jgi:hypothetical protein
MMLISDAGRRAINFTFREALPTRLTNPDRSAIIVIMQRLREDDTSGVILAGNYGYEHLMLRMRFDPDRRCETSIGFVDPRTEGGELLLPARFPAWVVDRDEEILGPIATADAANADASRRPNSQARILAAVGKRRKYPAFEFILASVDTAYTEKKENDPSALTIWDVWPDDQDRSRAMLIWARMKHLEMHGQLPDKAARRDQGGVRQALHALLGARRVGRIQLPSLPGG